MVNSPFRIANNITLLAERLLHLISSRALRFLITNLCWHEQRKRNLLHNRGKSGSVEIVGSEWIQKLLSNAKIYLPLIIWCGWAANCTSAVYGRNIMEWWCKQMLQFPGSMHEEFMKTYGRLLWKSKVFKDKFMRRTCFVDELSKR